MVRTVVPTPALLFRYSALTFNAHRIHYDRDYARDVEGYPGLVVQGPLIATLILDHLLRAEPGARISAYSFRAASPAFDGEAMQIGFRRDGRLAHLRAAGPAGVVMMGTAELTT